jgi:threonine dehydrogenase-like Zn-dependent dehydrogenase
MTFCFLLVFIRSIDNPAEGEMASAKTDYKRALLPRRGKAIDRGLKWRNAESGFFNTNMKAVVYHGVKDVRVDSVPEPLIEQPEDAIIRVTTAAICGSDLHLYGGLVPTLKKGDILGHEFMGEVVATGTGVKQLKEGDRVVVSFHISCGHCFFCKGKMYSLCDESNKGNEMNEQLYGYTTAGIFGYSHLFGGYPGGQAEFVRVPFADINSFKVPEGLTDEQALFVGDIFSTGYMAAENCGLEGGETVAVWGAGPVGQFAVKSLKMLGAGRIIVIDNVPERLALARESGAETIDDSEGKVFETLKDLTKHGPDACIDAVGMEAHAEDKALNKVLGAIDKAKQAVMPGMDSLAVLRQIIHASRKGAKISIAGVYTGADDKFPIGPAFNKGLSFKMGQTHIHRYAPMLLDKIAAGEIDPSFVITHRLPLDQAPEAYKMFRDKKQGCIKVILKP